jgi:mono/diheme cytochrome c family protein
MALTPGRDWWWKVWGWPDSGTQRERWQEIAKSWCSGCHLIEADDAMARDGVPSLVAVAVAEPTTVASLQAFRQTPNYRMPDWHLTHQEVDDLVTCIMSLRATRSWHGQRQPGSQA